MWADAVKRDLWPPLHAPYLPPDANRSPVDAVPDHQPPRRLRGDVHAQPSPGDLPREDQHCE
jgi:hypothetical protein